MTANQSGVRHWRALPVAALDTTGCGDAFCGRLVVALACDTPLPAAIRVAQLAAALTAERRGAFAALPSVAELAIIA